MFWVNVEFSYQQLCSSGSAVDGVGPGRCETTCVVCGCACGYVRVHVYESVYECSVVCVCCLIITTHLSTPKSAYRPFHMGVASKLATIYVAMLTPILYDNSYSLNDSNLKSESYQPYG